MIMVMDSLIWKNPQNTHLVPILSSDKIFTWLQAQCLLHQHLLLPQSQLRSLADVSVLGHRLVRSSSPYIVAKNLQPPPTVPAASLVVNRNPPARSPTPPTRVIKSTYGGNLFTSDDVLYLKKYIDYCQDQCLVLRCVFSHLAILAFHRTFFCVVYVKFARGLPSRYVECYPLYSN